MTSAMIQDIKPNIAKALFCATKQLPDLVCDMVNLEGVNYTLPEIQTLLDGITVGGHKQSDELITTNNIAAWKFLFTSIERKEFEVSHNFVIQLHQKVSQNEALQSGKFRDGKVFIAGTHYEPPAHTQLKTLWQELSAKKIVGDNLTAYSGAISVFLQIARNQFFYDGNKRTGRLMMNGMLLNYGLPVINLPASKQLEFNTLMIDFYATGDECAMQEFMLSCLDTKILEIMME